MNIGRENETVEFKKSTSELKEGIISIASILNKHGKGTLYFGVKDNGDVVGQQIGKETLKDISSKIRNSISPALVFHVEQKQTANGLTFIEVNFNGSNTPYSAHGRYYLRFHEEDAVMDNEILREYILSARRDYSKWEESQSNCTLKDIDENELIAYVERANNKKRLKLKYSDAKTVLGKLGLLYDDNTLNNAGRVLFSKNKPVRLKLAKFASESRSTILEMDNFDGNIFECIRKGEDFYASNINWRIDVTGKTQHTEIPEIPMIAVHEILINAFSHGEYESATDFELDIYSNRISIYSPGFFPKPYVPEDFANNGIEPIPLNVKISNILYKDGTIEQISSGFERTFKECKKNDIEYEYMDTGYGFRFTFYRSREKKDKLSKTDSAVLTLITNNPNITYLELAKACEVSESTILRTIKKLKKMDLIIREGSDKDGKWIIK